MHDFKKLKNEKPAGIYASPMEDDIMAWHAVILGCTSWNSGMAHQDYARIALA